MQAGLIQESLSLQVVHELKMDGKKRFAYSELRTLSNIPLDWQCCWKTNFRMNRIWNFNNNQVNSFCFMYFGHTLYTFDKGCYSITPKHEIWLYFLAKCISMQFIRPQTPFYGLAENNGITLKKRERGKNHFRTHSEWHTVNKHDVYCVLRWNIVMIMNIPFTVELHISCWTNEQTLWITIKRYQGRIRYS